MDPCVNLPNDKICCPGQFYNVNLENNRLNGGSCCIDPSKHRGNSKRDNIKDEFDRFTKDVDIPTNVATSCPSTNIEVPLTASDYSKRVSSAVSSSVSTSKLVNKADDVPTANPTVSTSQAPKTSDATATGRATTTSGQTPTSSIDELTSNASTATPDSSGNGGSDATAAPGVTNTSLPKNSAASASAYANPLILLGALMFVLGL